MKEDSVIFIGLDTSKLKISVAVANGERNGEVRFFGDISSEPAPVASMVDKLSRRGAERAHMSDGWRARPLITLPTKSCWPRLPEPSARRKRDSGAAAPRGDRM